MTVVAHIQQSVPQDSIKRRIKEKGCELTRQGVPNHVIVDLDHPQLLGKGNVGDFIFASDRSGTKNPWNQSWIAVLELTSSNKSATKVKDQLNAATRVVRKLTNNNMIFTFRPIFAFGTKMHRIQIEKLKQEKIKFRGKSIGIKLVRCGSPLSKALQP